MRVARHRRRRDVLTVDSDINIASTLSNLKEEMELQLECALYKGECAQLKSQNGECPAHSECTFQP